VFVLTWLSIGNAAFTFLRKRHYRLFETSVDVAPSTPSAHRVRVDSSPVSSSPLRFLTKIIGDASAESRTHPDPERDVWELAVWDPLPICLQLFCLFSPGHVLVYCLFLPISSLDPRPSTTVATTILLQILMSVQLLFLESNFSQQSKDTAVIHKEVLNEYDTKFVHPRLNPQVRDVSTQFDGGEYENDAEVETYTPTTILRRGFKTNPNPNYAKFVDPDDSSHIQQRMIPPTPIFRTPLAGPATYNRRESTPLRTAQTPQAAIRQPQFRQSISGISTSTSTHNMNSSGYSSSGYTSTGSGDGGSLGIYSHANSPLKKASSMYDMSGGRRDAPRNSLQAAEREIAEDRQRERERSPMKRVSKLGNGEDRRTTLPPGFMVSRGEDATKRGYY